MTLPPPTFKNDYVIVKPSPVHRNGLFSKTFIPKNTRICDYEGEMMTITDFNKMFDRDYCYTYKMSRIHKIISGKTEPFLSLNPSHYCNESVSPNVCLKSKGLYSLIDIPADEELFLKYPKKYPRTYILGNISIE